MTSSALFLTRSLSLGLAGLICALYGMLVLIFGRPDPMPFWIPGLAGVAASVAICLSISASSKEAMRATYDEGYHADEVRAQRIGFWVAIWLYPIFAVPLFLGWIGWPSAFAAMGTLTAATYLLGSVYFDMRGR